jgi:hypothetical protein
MKTMLHALVVTTSLALTGGCAAIETESENSDEVLPLPAAMVSADRDGARLDIYQLETGDLAVVATGDVPEGLEGKTPVEIYELIAGARAPAKLVERQTEIAALQALNPSDHVGSVGEEAAPDRSPITALTGSSFQSTECNPGVPVDFDLCYLYRTGDYIRRFTNIHWIHAHLNAYSGTVTHSMWYRSFLGRWQLINTDVTTGSSFVSLFSEGADGDYEVWVTSAAGDGYHLSMHGDF